MIVDTLHKYIKGLNGRTVEELNQTVNQALNSNPAGPAPVNFQTANQALDSDPVGPAPIDFQTVNQVLNSNAVGPEPIDFKDEKQKNG